MTNMKQLVMFTATILALWACGSSSDDFYAPKQRGYHRIELPVAAYQPLPDTFPYFFEYSKHARLLNDTSHIAERFWMEVYYPEFTANIDVSYKVIRNRRDLADYVNDCYKLAQKHNIKAEAIEEIVSTTPTGYTSVVYELSGDVPTTFQFYVTDSVNHFLRTSLYFPTSVKNDSLAPIIDFIKRDMMHMMNTVDWNKSRTF